MQIRILSNYDEMCREAANFITGYISQNPDALLCFPSGDTPTGIFKYLVEDSRAGKLNLENCTFVGLDEWEGLNGRNQGSGRHYMDEHLFVPLGIKPERIHFFDGSAVSLEQECSRINDFIRDSGPIDLMMVGLGLNGHVGLNEPGVDFSSYAHVSDLAPLTIESAKKYFREETPLSRGITLGTAHLLEARVAVIIASGTKKATVIAKALEGEVSNEVPASIIQRHPAAHIFLDGEAAAFLSGRQEG